MELIKKFIPQTINYKLSDTEVVRLKQLSLCQYIDCRELVKTLKNYQQTHNRKTLSKIYYLTNSLKNNIIQQNDISPAPIIDMNIFDFMTLLNHLLPNLNCHNESHSQLDITYATGKIMTIFPRYSINELLNMPVQSFFAFYELADKMQADFALEVHYAATLAFHNGNTAALRQRRGNPYHTAIPDTEYNIDEVQAVRKLACELAKTHKEHV